LRELSIRKMKATILLILLALVVTLVVSPPPIKSELQYHVSVEKGVITLADVQSGKSVSKPIAEWGITVPTNPTIPTQDRLRHLALDFTAVIPDGKIGPMRSAVASDIPRSRSASNCACTRSPSLLDVCSRPVS
jgi:hypothetical protein